MTVTALTSAAESELVPVVLIHGFGATASLTWQATGWTRALDTAQRRWIAVDLLGHGAAGKPHDQASYSRDALVYSIAAVLDHHEFEVADVVGYSLGGELALHLAAAEPARVRRLVVGGVGRHRPFRPGSGEQIRTHLASGKPISDPGLAAIWSAATSIPSNDPAALAALVEGWSRAPALAEALRYPGPALMFRGDADPVSSGMIDLARRLDQASYVEIEGRNHMTTLVAGEAKRQAVEFLDGNDARRAVAAGIADFLHVVPEPTA
jgi:pimeloyl-ACP methyl ester carboxylesterase